MLDHLLADTELAPRVEEVAATIYCKPVGDLDAHEKADIVRRFQPTLDLRKSMAHQEELARVRAGELPSILKSGGEGTRGGHVIGHTRSGKPIYAASHAAYSDIHAHQSAFTGGERKKGPSQAKIDAHNKGLKGKLDEHFPGWSQQDHQDARDAHMDASRKDVTKMKENSVAVRAHQHALNLGGYDPKKAPAKGEPLKKSVTAEALKGALIAGAILKSAGATDKP